ncbi:MAG: hypothetical protein AB8F95_17665 [Bacteroidia bacterium]
MKILIQITTLICLLFGTAVLLHAEPQTAEAKVKAWNVSHVKYDGTNSGEFQYTSYNGWVEYKANNAKAHATFKETHRDEWTVYLKKSDGASVKLNLHTKKVIVNNRPSFSITSATAASPNGRNVTWVTGDALKPSIFKQTGAKTWQEIKVGERGVHATFTETQRDAWSVYLRKSDGARIQIDLHTKKIKVNNSTLYTIIDSRAKMAAKPPVTGKVTNVRPGGGRMPTQGNAGRAGELSNINKPATTAKPLTQGFKQIQNRWKSNQYIHNERGAIEVGPMARSDWWSAQWSFVQVQGTKYVRIQSRFRPGQYLHNQNGKLEVGRLGAPGWWSAQWEIVKVPGTKFVQIRNRWKPNQYLHNQNGRITVGPLGAPGWWSAQWLIKDKG